MLNTLFLIWYENYFNFNFLLNFKIATKLFYPKYYALALFFLSMFIDIKKSNVWSFLSLLL